MGKNADRPCWGHSRNLVEASLWAYLDRSWWQKRLSSLRWCHGYQLLILAAGHRHCGHCGGQNRTDQVDQHRDPAPLFPLIPTQNLGLKLTTKNGGALGLKFNWYMRKPKDAWRKNMGEKVVWFRWGSLINGYNNALSSGIYNTNSLHEMVIEN